METLCYLGILKERFSPYSSPVILISRKMTQDKLVVTDFRHLIVRIVKNNLAYTLVRDTFSVSTNSECKIPSVLDLKETFHLLRLLEDSKRYCCNYHIMEVPHTYIRECLWDWIYHLQFGDHI